MDFNIGISDVLFLVYIKIDKYCLQYYKMVYSVVIS